MNKSWKIERTGHLTEAVALADKLPSSSKKMSESEMQEFKAELIELLDRQKVK